MPIRIFLFSISILCLLFPGTLFSAVPCDHPPVDSFQRSQKTILQSHVTFEESINDLSKIFNVKIEIAGPFSGPSAKFDLNLNHATLEEAVKEAIRKAGVQNHALVWDKTGKALRLLTFESGKSPGPTTTNDIDPFGEEMNLLSQEQLFLLAEQSAVLEAEEAESNKPLTPEQIEQLKEESDKLEAVEQESNKPLTTLQLQRLIEQSTALKAEEAESKKPLTSEQLQRLKNASTEFAEETKKSQQPLSEEQLLLLQESDLNNNNQGKHE